MTTLPSLKRGDTFSLSCTQANADNTPEDLTGITIRSQIRTIRGELVCDLTVTKLDQTISPGVFVLESNDTKSWPVGTCYLDVEYTTEGVVTSSETIELPVIRDITQ